MSKSSKLTIVPKEWKIKKIAEVGKVVTGATPKTSDKNNWNGELPFVSPSDISTNKYVTATERTVQKDVIGHNRLIPENSILYTCIASIGKIALTSKECTTNQQINSIIPNNDMSVDYLYYSLLHRTKYIKTLAATTAVPIINKSLFSGIEVLLPELKEQQKIAVILSSVDEAIEKTEQIIEQKEIIIEGLLQKLLTKSFNASKSQQDSDLPQGWENVTLGDIMEYSPRREAVLNEDEYNLIGVRLYAKGTYIHSKKVGSELKTKTVYKIEKHDIIYNRMWPTKGAFTIVEDDNKNLYGTNEYPTFTAKQKRIDLRFIKYIMLTTQFWNNASAYAKGTTGRARLHQNDFLKLKIILPPLKEQKVISQILDSVTENIEIEKDRLTYLKDVLKGLMQQLLTGKVRVPIDNKKEVLS